MRARRGVYFLRGSLASSWLDDCDVKKGRLAVAALARPCNLRRYNPMRDMSIPIYS